MVEFLGATAAICFGVALLGVLARSPKLAIGSIVIGCVVFFVVEGAANIGSSGQATGAADADASQGAEPPMIGERGTLGKGASGLACTATKDELHAMIDAMVKNDDDGFREATADGFVLHGGDRVLVLERDGFAGLDMRLRMLTGPNAHLACWTEADTHNLFR